MVCSSKKHNVLIVNLFSLWGFEKKKVSAKHLNVFRYLKTHLKNI